jgi:hypothetical protein
LELIGSLLDPVRTTGETTIRFGLLRPRTPGNPNVMPPAAMVPATGNSARLVFAAKSPQNLGKPRISAYISCMFQCAIRGKFFVPFCGNQTKAIHE